MTCVWDALRAKIRSDDLRNILGVQHSSAHNLVAALKNKNISTRGVRWQGTELKGQELEENMKWIEAHDIRTISSGYDCSTADPYLILVCFLLKIKIVHSYMNHQIVYEPPGPPRYTLHFQNNRGHFW